MGNSGGNLKEYWEAIENYHGLQGGFIWEWLDHGLLERHKDDNYWAYGGDFGEWRHDLNFVCDGLCWPDRTPHSSLIEYKKVVEPVAVTRISANRYQVTNKNYFTDLSWLQCTWQVEVNGSKVQSGQAGRLKIGPQESKIIELPLSRPALKSGQEAVLTISFEVASATNWAPKGHRVAWAQFRIGRRKSTVPRYQGSCKLESKTNRPRKSATGTYRVSTPNTKLVISNRGLESWKFLEHEFIAEVPGINLWRAPLDNDGIKGWGGQDGKALGRWLRQGIDELRFRFLNTKCAQNRNGTIAVQATVQVIARGGTMTVKNSYLVCPDDSIQVEHIFKVSAGLADLPRVGIRWVLPAGFEHFEWYGLGPHETYCDRKTSGQTGLYKSSVADQYVPYILPQDHGNHMDVRWLRLANDNGVGLGIVSNDDLQASVSHYPHEVLTPAFHTWELKPRAETYLCLDAAQRGVGGASCGPDTLPRYRIAAGDYKLSYSMKPVIDQPIGSTTLK
jgi:beta-galactosidase